MRPHRLAVIVIAALVALTGCVPGSSSAPTAPPRTADCSPLKNLAVLAWADHAGIVPAKRSLSTWFEEHPEASRFAPLPADEPLDVVELWQQREQQPEPWDDLVRYLVNEGEPWLLETDLDEVVPGDRRPGRRSGRVAILRLTSRRAVKTHGCRSRTRPRT